ncbi:recombinase RecT [Streptomyces sp. NPDC086182]|uniref:recombinase RecT n=1 Tax=Streptomyces sp. NPDC086182 TaxID=3155058 RepID=UPI0034170D4B
MSTELVKAEPQQRPGGALSLAHMSPQEAWRFSEALAGASLLPQEYRNNASSVLWAMEYGRALGLDVVTTITTIHVIKGKPTQSADLMLSRTREAGHKVRIRQEPGQCTVSIWRYDDPDFENTITWTYDDAVTAGLCELRNDRPYSRSQKGEKQNWEKYPRAMLRARAISECVRSACPEVLHGAIYTAEELGARVDDAGIPMDAEVQQLRRVEPGQADQWTTATPTPKAAVEGRDYLHEATEAADAATVRNIYDEAKADGAVPEYLAQIAQVGVAKEKAAADAAKTGEQSRDEVVDVTVVGDPEDEHAAAVDELRAAAKAAQLEDFENGARMALGMPIEDATPQAIRALAAQIRPAA